MIGKYQKKPSLVEAIQFDGDNSMEIRDWCKVHLTMLSDGTFLMPVSYSDLHIHVSVGDYIVKDLAGGYHTIPKAIFEEKYEEVK